MTEQRNDAVRPCPFCSASMTHCTDKDGEFWIHPGVVTVDDCFMSGQGIFPRRLAAWNTRAQPPAPFPLEGEVRERLAKMVYDWNPERYWWGKETYPRPWGSEDISPINKRMAYKRADEILAALSTEAGSGVMPGWFRAALRAAQDSRSNLILNSGDVGAILAAIAEAGKPAPSEPVAVWQADIATILSHHHLGGPWRQYRQEPPFAAVCGCGETFYAKSEGDARTAWIAHVSDYLYAAPVEPAPSEERLIGALGEIARTETDGALTSKRMRKIARAALSGSAVEDKGGE